MHIWHDWLVHGTIPLNVSGTTHAVPVDVLVVLMVDWSLAGAPLAMSIWSGSSLGQYTSQRPVEQVRVVDESLSIEAVIVQDNRAVVAQTTSNSSNDEPADVKVG